MPFLNLKMDAIFLTGDVVALRAFVFAVTAVISIFIAILLKLVLKQKLKLYWYFIIGVAATIVLFLMAMRNLDVLL